MMVHALHHHHHAATSRREYHPAVVLYLLIILLLCLALLLGFISLFVPWVQKDIAIGTRVFSYPFTTCYVQTFSPVHQQTCMDNDFIVGPKGAPLTGGNNTCKEFLLVAIGLGFVAFLVAFLVLFLLVFVILRVWSRPLILAIICQVFIIIVPASSITSYSVFIAYAEMTCLARSIFPVKGDSYGFILLVFSSALSLGATVTGFLGIRKLKNYQVLDLDAKEEEFYVPSQMEVPIDGVYAGYEYNPYAAPTPIPTTNSPRHVFLY